MTNTSKDAIVKSLSVSRSIANATKPGSGVGRTVSATSARMGEVAKKDSRIAKKDKTGTKTWTEKCQISYLADDLFSSFIF